MWREFNRVIPGQPSFKYVWLYTLRQIQNLPLCVFPPYLNTEWRHYFVSWACVCVPAPNARTSFAPPPFIPTKATERMFTSRRRVILKFRQIYHLTAHAWLTGWVMGGEVRWGEVGWLAYSRQTHINLHNGYGRIADSSSIPQWFVALGVKWGGRMHGKTTLFDDR